MAIKPLTVLPQLRPVTYRPPQNNNGSMRILEEMIQQENANERSRQAGLLLGQREYGEVLKEGLKDLGDSPLALSVLDEYRQRAIKTSERMRNTNDPYELMNAVNDEGIRLRSDPRVAQAYGESLRMKTFQDVAAKNADSIDGEYFTQVMGKYYDPERKDFMKPTDFNLGKLFLSPEKFADKFVKDIQATDDQISYDKFNNKAIVKRNTILPDEDQFKTRMAERMVASGQFNDWDSKKMGDFITRTYNDAKSRTKGVEVRNFESYTDDNDAALKAAKENAGVEKGLTPGDSFKFSNGEGYLQTNNDGVISVYDKAGTLVKSGTLDKVWSSIPEYYRSQLRDKGFEPNFDTPIGNKADLARAGKKVTSVSGLAEDDALLIKGKPSQTTFDEKGWMTTNDPQAIRNAGYKVTYNPDTKKYYIQKQDASFNLSGELIEEGTGVFTTDGGSGKDSEKIFKINIGSKPKVSTAQKNSPVDFSSDDIPEIQFIAPEESGKEGDRAINPSDNGSPSIGATQINDLDTQVKWLDSIGLGEDWRSTVNDDKQKRSTLKSEHDKKIKDGMSKADADKWHDAERKKLNTAISKDYKDLINGVTDEQRKTLALERNNIMEETFWEPSRQVFEEEFGVSIPEKIKGLWAAMAGQHTKGMIGNKALVKDINEAAGDGEVKRLLQEGKVDEVIDIISDVRKEYISKLDLPNKDSLIKRVERDRTRAKGSVEQPTVPVVPKEKSPVDSSNTFKAKRINKQ